MRMRKTDIEAARKDLEERERERERSLREWEREQERAKRRDESAARMARLVQGLGDSEGRLTVLGWGQREGRNALLYDGPIRGKDIGHTLNDRRIEAILSGRRVSYSWGESHITISTDPKVWWALPEWVTRQTGLTE